MDKFIANIKYILFTMLMEDHAPSFTLKRSRVIAYNSNWYNRAERPFTKAHEIGHAISSIVTVLYGGSSYSEEAIADMVATQLLYEYSNRKGDGFSEPGPFMNQYGIPEDKFAYVNYLFTGKRLVYFPQDEFGFVE